MPAVYGGTRYRMQMKPSKLGRWYPWPKNILCLQWAALSGNTSLIAIFSSIFLSLLCALLGLFYCNVIGKMSVISILYSFIDVVSEKLIRKPRLLLNFVASSATK